MTNPCDLLTLRTEAGRPWMWGQPVLQGETLAQTNKKLFFSGILTFNIENLTPKSWFWQLSFLVYWFLLYVGESPWLFPLMGVHRGPRGSRLTHATELSMLCVSDLFTYPLPLYCRVLEDKGCLAHCVSDIWLNDLPFSAVYHFHFHTITWW